MLEAAVPSPNTFAADEPIALLNEGLVPNAAVAPNDDEVPKAGGLPNTGALPNAPESGSTNDGLLHFIKSQIFQSGLSLGVMDELKRTLGERRCIPWTGHQPLAGYRQINNYRQYHNFVLIKLYFFFSLLLICV